MKSEIEDLNYNLTDKGITDIQIKLREARALYE